MQPKLKISNLTHLQDARYAAAVGFNLIGFNLKRGDRRKLPANMVWSMATWLDGPEVVVETDTASLDELQSLSSPPPYLRLPLEEWNPHLFTYGSALILGGDGLPALAQLREILTHSSGEHEIKFELSFEDPSDLSLFEPLYGHLLAHFPNFAHARKVATNPPDGLYGLSLREEVEEEPLQLDYEALDDFMALFSDVHL